LIQVAAGARCYGVPTRAWHSVSIPAIPSSTGLSPAPLSHTHNAAVPLAKGKREDLQPAAAHVAASRTPNLHDKGDDPARLPRTAPKRSDGWKNMRNSSLSVA
jgi:hypothetical protein